MRKVALKLAVVLVVLTLSVPAAAQSTVRLPDLGGSSTQVLTPEQARSFPLDFEHYMRAHELLIDDPLIRGYFEDMGYRLVSYSDRASEPFHFFVLREPSINAFAMPAGVIGLHTGLILAASDESEVAGVVAHEIAHVTQDHIARGIESSQQVSLPTLLATIGLALAAGAAGAGGEASQAILMGGISLAQQFQISHTRQHEAEADRIGIQLLARAGYDPQGMARFFERLNRLSRPMGEGPPEYLRTHPLTVNRIAEARARADGLSARAPAGRDDFHFVQARLRAMSSDARQAELWFRARLDGNDRPPLAIRYGLALTLLGDRRLDEARREIDALLTASPDHQLFALLEARLLIEENRVSEAIAGLDSLYQQYPGNRLITTEYAQALMHERNDERARQTIDLLRPYLHRYPDDLRMTELYARAASRAGDPVRAAEALADSYYMRGGVREAIVQLERIIERDDLDYYQRSRVNARLVELRSERLRLIAQGRGKSDLQSRARTAFDRQ